jgi:hypothetical protein
LHYLGIRHITSLREPFGNLSPDQMYSAVSATRRIHHPMGDLMAAASTSPSNAPDDESLAIPVGGNALNADGEATHNPDRLGAGTPSGSPEAEAPDAAETND